MELNKEYKQLYLKNTHSRDNDILQFNGKVVDKIALANDDKYEDQCELIITFKDKTFIAFEIDDINDGDSEEQVYNIQNSSIVHPKCYNHGHLPHWFDHQGKLHFMPLVQNRVDLGIWKVTEEEVEKLLEYDKKMREESEWKQYLYLKEKFKNKIENNEK